MHQANPIYQKYYSKMTDDSDVGDVEIKFGRGTRAYTPPGGAGLAEPHFTHYYETAASLSTPEPYTHFTLLVHWSFTSLI